MCLILLAWRMHAEFDLVVAANRDEFYARASAPLAYWEDLPEVLAGRDLEAGGTWMGVTRSGRVAAITNYRDPTNVRSGAPSRGHLVGEFLAGSETPGAYLKRIAASGDRYNGYNLLVSDRSTLWYYSNRDGAPRALSEGVYGLSNHLLDTPWPKVETGKRRLREVLELNGAHLQQRLFEILRDRNHPADSALPKTGVGLELERTLSPLFIVGEHYGTRASTVLTRSSDGSVEMTETTFEREFPRDSRRFRF